MRIVKYAVQGTLLAAGLSLISPSFPADEVVAMQSVRHGQVEFISGGVGEDQSDEMKRLAASYPLELLFVAKGNPNQYLANVSVQIRDKSGNVVLDTITPGPFLLAKLAPGRYTVTADSEGTVRRQTVQVGTKKQRVMMMWAELEPSAQAGPKTADTQ